MSNEAKIIAGIVIIAGLAIATVATGGAAGGVAGFILAGAFKGAAIGAVSGGLISGTIGGLTSRSWEGFVDGFSTGFMTGAFIGGVTGTASNAFKVAKAAQSWAASSGKSSYGHMVSHYRDHVINEGQKHIAKNIVNYSKHANQFWASNSSHAYRIGADAFKIAGGRIGFEAGGYGVALKGVADVGTAALLIGYMETDKGWFVGLSAKASVASARVGIQFDLGQFGIEIGGSAKFMTTGEYQLGFGNEGFVLALGNPGPGGVSVYIRLTW